MAEGLTPGDAGGQAGGTSAAGLPADRAPDPPVQRVDVVDITDPAERIREFGRFLRSRRARVAPETAGFPTGPRRRYPGLRREEVAVLAGLSPTWYAYLEQGRRIRPSPEVLDSLSRVLGLTEDERRYMHLLALGHAPADSVEKATATSEELWRLIDVIGAGDEPVYVGNQYADMLAWNDAVTRWYTDFGRLPDPRRNMLWWMLTAPEARERIQDWENDTRDVVARLRANYALRPHDPVFHDRVQMLSQASPLFREWWDELVVREQHPRPRVLSVPGLGTRSYQVVTLRISRDGFYAAIAHIPLSAEGILGQRAGTLLGPDD